MKQKAFLSDQLLDASPYLSILLLAFQSIQDEYHFLLFRFLVNLGCISNIYQHIRTIVFSFVCNSSLQLCLNRANSLVGCHFCMFSRAKLKGVNYGERRSPKYQFGDVYPEIVAT